jgi:hypothetical protein
MTKRQSKNIALAKKWLKYFHRQYNEDDLEDVTEYAIGLSSYADELDIINYIREKYKKVRYDMKNNTLENLDVDSIPFDDENIAAFEDNQYKEVLEKELDKILTKREKALFLYRLEGVPYEELSPMFHMGKRHLVRIFRNAKLKVKKRLLNVL